MRIPRFSFAFSSYLAILFGVVVVATALTIAWVSDRGVVMLLEANGSANTERAARQIGAEIEGLFAPIEVGVSLMAHHRTNMATSLSIRLEGASFFRETLTANRSAAAFYIGYKNGDFFLVRRLRDQGERAFFNVDGRVEYLVQSIDRDGGPTDGRYVYLDKDGEVLGETERPGYPMEYDPRRRIWYEQALLAQGVVRTDLYVFQTTGQVGLTFATRSPIAETVVAADLNLDTLSGIVTRLRPTPGAQVILLNRNEQVVAHETTEMLYTGVLGDAVRLKGLASYPAPELRAMSGRVQSAAKPGEHIRYVVDGRQWLAKAAPIALRGGDPLTLLVAMPEDELLREAFEIRDRILIASLMIFLVAVALTFTLSMSTSGKLLRLDIAARRVRHFDFSARFDEASPIREIDALGRSLEQLRGAYASFMRMLTLIQQESERSKLLPVLLNEWSAALNTSKAVFYSMNNDESALVVEAVKDDGRIFIFRGQHSGLMPNLLKAVVAEGAPGFLAGSIAPQEAAMPGLRNLTLSHAAQEHALAFALRDCKGVLVGAILFLGCEDRADGAEDLVAALTGTAATWMQARRPQPGP